MNGDSNNDKNNHNYKFPKKKVKVINIYDREKISFHRCYRKNGIGLMMKDAPAKPLRKQRALIAREVAVPPESEGSATNVDPVESAESVANVNSQTSSNFKIRVDWSEEEPKEAPEGYWDFENAVEYQDDANSGCRPENTTHEAGPSKTINST